VRTYKVLNDDDVFVEVSDKQLDEASVGTGPLPTQLAHAAAIAGRKDLIARLRETLHCPERHRKLAAAMALLAFQDQAFIPVLTQSAATEPDSIVAKVFEAVALRLQGAAHACDYFTREDSDPQICRLLISNYNSYLKLGVDDVRFLLAVLRAYIDKDLPWIKHLRKDVWANGIYFAVDALATDSVLRLLGGEQLVKERQELHNILSRITALPVGSDTKTEAAELQRRLPTT
jgi:hypothetical protein